MRAPPGLAVPVNAPRQLSGKRPNLSNVRVRFPASEASTGLRIPANVRHSRDPGGVNCPLAPKNWPAALMERKRSTVVKSTARLRKNL